MKPPRARSADKMLARVNANEIPAREPRVRVSMRASVQVSADRSVAAHLVDLSRLGFRLISDEPLKTGHSVELSNRKDASLGEIRWVRGLEAGGQFTDLPRITE